MIVPTVELPGTSIHERHLWTFKDDMYYPAVVPDDVAPWLPPGVWCAESTDLAHLDDAFLVWALHQPSGAPFGLLIGAGRVVACSPRDNLAALVTPFAAPDLAVWMNAQSWASISPGDQ